MLFGVLVLVGCGEVAPAVVDGGPALVELATVDGAAARSEEPAPFSPTVGDPCEPSFRCDVPLPPAMGCECVPPVRYPSATASLGAYCEPTARRCCAWFVVSPVPFIRLENCGEGWTCSGERCP